MTLANLGASFSAPLPFKPTTSIEGTVGCKWINKQWSLMGALSAKYADRQQNFQGLLKVSKVF
jgi:hypothetical protein